MDLEMVAGTQSKDLRATGGATGFDSKEAERHALSIGHTLLA